VRGSDKDLIIVNGGSIESVAEFPYIGSVISSGRVDTEVESRI